MPTYSVIQLDRLLEQRATTTTAKTTSLRHDTENLPEDSFPELERRKTTSLPPHPQLSRRNSVSITPQFDNNNNNDYNYNGDNGVVRPSHISPALYTTPEPTPLPVSPTSGESFSPFLINYKRRGPRFSKSFSVESVAMVSMPSGGVGGGGGGGLEVESEESKNVRLDSENEVGKVDGDEVGVNGGGKEEVGEVEAKTSYGRSYEREGGESDDFFDPQDSMSYTSSTDAEDFVGERSAKANTPMGEFYDAWDELLSSESGQQASQRSFSDVDTELREMRLTLLMEIEKRKQIEEVVLRMRSQWQMLRAKLGDVGIDLPADLASLDDSQSDGVVTDIEDICRQIQLARAVSESVGRGIARAEAEAEMEAQLEVKNFEIARLCDRLHYYETMNREMSQRNQEAVEVARCDRQKRRKRQKWIWGLIATAITIGSTALAWSFLPGGEGSSSTEIPEASKPESNIQ